MYRKDLMYGPVKLGMNPQSIIGRVPPDPTPFRAGRPSRALTMAACLTIVVGGLVACAAGEKAPSTGTAPPPSAATSTTSAPVTSATSPPVTAAATTSAPAATTIPAPATTTLPAPSTSSGYPLAAYDAWTRGDRTAAAAVAEPAAVDTLFARTWSSADGWAFVNCQGAAGSVFCTWQRSGEEVLIKAPNAPGGLPVNEVTFRPSP
jgi:hypothetical protein